MVDVTPMWNIQQKAWALVIGAVGLLTAVVVWFSSQSTSVSFTALEHQRAEQDGTRARRLLEQQLTQLSASGKDYAYWIDAVKFIAGQNPTHMEDNFTADSMDPLGISGVLVFDVRGRLVGEASATDGEELGAQKPDLLKFVRSLVPAVVGDQRSETVIDTYHRIGQTLYLFSAAPVREQAAVGTVPKGVQVVYRRFGDLETERFSQVLLSPVAVSLAPVPAGAPDQRLITLDEQRAESRAVIRDHQNKPVAELVVSVERDLHRQAQALVYTSALQVALAGLVLGSLLLFLLDRLVLRRLTRLHQELQRVTNQGPAAGAEVSVEGQDELSDVSRDINGLLARVRSDAQTLREDQERNLAQQLEIQRMQMQKTEAMSRLTAGLAHDFNNSLAAITGWTRLARDDLEVSHPSLEAMEQALKAARYADGLLRQLMAFGRQSVPSLRRLHLALLAQEAREMVSAGLAKGCELTVDCRVDDDEVDADPTQLQQVLVNLLINAADAMKGIGRIEIILEGLTLPVSRSEVAPPGSHGLPDGRYVVLRVRDHGPGIPLEIQSRIFDPFFSTKPKGKGTGLGLSVAQGVIARHDGAIGLTSGPDGTCFFVCLPVSRREVTMAPVTVPGGLETGRQLLFVDDDSSVRHAWSALLERRGWQVTRARDGEEGWAQFSQSGKQFDVILTDQSMPRLDGVGLAQRIRSTQSPPPIVLMSGHVAEVNHLLCKELFAAVLHKPVDDAELDRVLRKLLSGGSISGTGGPVRALQPYN